MVAPRLRLPGLVALAGAVLLAACEYPTKAPFWETTWNVPGKTARIAVSELLPAEVGVTPDSSAFVVAVGSVALSRTLGADCSSCAVFDGQRVPKPAFTMSLTDSTTIPDRLASATLGGDTLVVGLNNGFGFDPIRPSADPANPRGYVVFDLVNGGTVVAHDSLDGNTFALPAGLTTIKIPLTGTIGAANALRFTVKLHSPAGDTITVNSAASVNIDATMQSASVGELRVSNVSVIVLNDTISSAPTELDLSGVDSTVANRLVSGKLLLTITNPFGIQGNFDIAISGGTGGAINRTMTLLPSPTSTTELSFTPAELESLLGHVDLLSLTGAVSSIGGTVPITPTEAVQISTRLELVVTTKSQP